MALVVNTNVPSIASQRYLMESRKEMETAMERLSSGKRINSASDDAAGLAISTRMDSQIKGLNMAIRNANDGISLAQTAEGAMSEVTDILQRMRELALQSVHGVNNDDDRATLDAEVQQLKDEIDRVAATTTFNDQALLDGTFNRLLQIGKDVTDVMQFSIGSMTTQSLGMVTSAAEQAAAGNSLISARLGTGTFYDTVGASGGGSFGAGDVLINGQALDAFDGTSATSAGGHDIYDLVANINKNVDTVTASAQNIVVAKSAGNGVLADSQMAITVHAIGVSTDPHYVPSVSRTLGASSSMSELVDNINAAFDNSVLVAAVNSEGKLQLSNETGARIQVADISGTTSAYDGGSGFAVSGAITTFGTDEFGFLKLASADGSAIEITKGNAGLTSPGTDADLAVIGFNMVDEDPTGVFNTLTGTQLTSALVSNTFSKDDQTNQADLSINGVGIYDETLSASSNTFQGKLDLINAFTDETGVVASAYFEKVVDMSQTTFVGNNQLRINGVDVNYGADIDALKTNINTVSGTTGITASVNGDNLILKGDGVQSVNIKNVEYELSSSTVQAAARRSTDTFGAVQTATFANADVSAGRVFTLLISGDTKADFLSAASQTFTYTVGAGEDAEDVAKGFRDLILLHITENDGAFTGNSAGNYVSYTASGQVTFQTALSVGSANITIAVTQTAAANLAFSSAAGTSASYFAALRLQSMDNNPIRIEMGESAVASEGGFLETNVGDSTWDVNTPSAELSATSSGGALTGLSIATSDAAQEALLAVDDALDTVTNARAGLGAIQNRLDYTVSNLSNVVENTSAAQSRIQDADFALEAAALARAQILQQAGTAMLAQANAAPQNVLSLLG